MPVNAEDLGLAVLRMVTDQTEYDRGLAEGKRKAQGFVADTSASLLKVGKSLSQTGKTMTTNITLPVLAAGAAIFTVGRDFETTLNQIVGLAGVSRESIGGIREEILGMAEAIGRDPQELAEAFYFVASAGFEADEAMEVLRTSAKAAAAGLGETQTVAKVLGGVINSYGKENITAARAADILVAAVRDGTAEAADFAGVIGDVVPTAAQLGVGFDQVTAALAGMTIAGISADESATSLNQVLLSLLKPTTEAEQALTGMGLSSAELRRQLREEGLLSVLRTLEDRFAGNDQAAAAVFGNVRALRGALALLGLDTDQLNGIFADTEAALGDVDSAFNETEGSARDQDRAMASIKRSLIELSEDVLPVVSDLLGQIAGFVRGATSAFKGLPQPVRGIIVQLLALAAVIGPTLFIVGKLTSGLGLLFGLFRTGGPLLRSATLLFGGLGKALAASSVVQSLGTGLAMALGKVAALPVVATAVSGLSTALGAMLAAAIPLGLAAVAGAIGLGIALAFKAAVLDPGLQQQTRDIGSSIDEQIATGVGDLEQSKRALEDGIKDIKAIPFGEFLYGDQIRDLEAQLDKVNAALAAKAAELPEGIVTALEYGQSEVDVAARMMVSGIGPAVAGAKDDAAAAGVEVGAAIPGAIGAGILEAQGQVDAAMATLRNLIENERTPTAQAAHVIGQLISKEVSNGVVSGRAGVKDAARSLRESGEAELRAFIAGGGKIGKKSMDALRDGMKSKDPEVRNQSKRTLKIIDQELDKLKGVGRQGGAGAGTGVKQGLDSKKPAVRGAAAGYRTTIRAQLPSSSEARRWGSGLGQNYAAGIRSSRMWIEQAARNAAAAAAAIFATHSPPGPESPLHHIVDWARTTMRLYADGLASMTGAVRAAARGAVGGAAAEFGRGRFGQGRFSGPRFDGMRVLSSRLPSMGPMPGEAPAHLGAVQARQGDSSTVVNLRTYGTPLHAETPADIVRRIRRASRLGTIAPAPLRPQWEGAG